MIQTIVVLLVVCAVYRLVHVLFTSLELIAKLPVIKSLDKLLGAVIGLAEAGLIVGILVYFLKNWGYIRLGRYARKCGKQVKNTAISRIKGCIRKNLNFLKKFSKNVLTKNGSFDII